MPSLDTAYIPAFSINTLITDKDTGLPLSGGIVTFYEDNNPTALKDVWQITGDDPTYTFTRLPNPMILSSIGSFVDGSGNPTVPYFLPYDDDGADQLYYITVYSSGAVFQFAREAVPHVDNTGDIIPAVEATSANQITNPQFVDVAFGSATDVAHTYTVTGSPETTSLAPGWDLITTGAGTFTATWVKTTTGANESSPSYALTLNTLGLGASATLQQRFVDTTNIFYGKLTYASFVAAAGSTSVSLTLNYVTSSGTTQELGVWTVPASGSLATYATVGRPEITAFNTDTQSNNAYINFNLVIPAGKTITLSSFQFLSVADATADVAFQQQTTAQQENNLFYYYNPLLQYKPIPSYLVGWDFALNPCQILGTAPGAQAAGANGAYYVADQTILFQTVNNGLSMTNTGGLFTITAAQTTSFAMIQYLGLPQARELLRGAMAVQVVCSKTGAALAARVDLMWTANTTPVVPVLPASLVTSITAGAPTFLAGWTAVTRKQETASFTPTTAATPFSFSGWDSSATDTSTATLFAIVVTFDTMTSTESVAFQYVSLVQGNIPTRPAPQTPDEVLRECQYYYETNYPLGATIGSANTVGAISVNQGINNKTATEIRLITSSFTTPYTLKRAIPSMAYYSTVGTVNAVSGKVIGDGAVTAYSDLDATGPSSGFWQYSPNTKYNSMTITGTTKLSNAIVATGSNYGTAYITYNFVADARLGVVV